MMSRDRHGSKGIKTSVVYQFETHSPCAVASRTAYLNYGYITGANAVTYGMADEIGEFSPAAGTKVLSALG